MKIRILLIFLTWFTNLVNATPLACGLKYGNYQYFVFEVVKPDGLLFEYGEAMPWFDKTGGATQIKSSSKFDEMLANKSIIIKEKYKFNLTKNAWEKIILDIEDISYGKNFTRKIASNTSLNAIEKSIAEESYQILNSSDFKKITDGFISKTPVQIEINDRTISYDDAPFSGMTWFDKNGFNIGRDAFKNEQELIKTVLHEMYRLKTSTLRGSASASEVTRETKAAFDYAEKRFNLFE